MCMSIFNYELLSRVIFHQKTSPAYILHENDYRRPSKI